MSFPQLEYKVCASIGRFETKSPATTFAQYKAAGSGTIERTIENPDQVTATENGPVGEVQFYAAVTGVKDEVGDIIVPGAFGRSLKARLPRVCLGHDWNRPIGRTVEVKELFPGDPALPATTSTGDPWPREAGALWVKALYNLRSPDGRQAFDDAVFMGKSATYSIGYVAQRHETKSGIRYLHDVDLWEYGPVLHPANGLATGISAKGQAPSNLETKVRRVKDSQFWGLPVGTPIKPGMKPRGKTAIALRRDGVKPDRNAGLMDREPTPAERAELEAAQAARSVSRGKRDIRAEANSAGLFDEPQAEGLVRASRRARGEDQVHLDNVYEDARERDSSSDRNEGRVGGQQRSDLAVHELTDTQQEGLRGLLDEGITPDEVDEELPDDIDPDHRASIMDAYRAAYRQRAEQQGTGRSNPPAEDPQAVEPAPSFGQAAAAQRAAAEAPAPAPAAPAGRGKTPRELAAQAFRRGNQPGGDPGPDATEAPRAHVDDPAVDRASLARTLSEGARGGNVGPARSVNGARTFLDRAGASAPREQHDPVQAAVNMAKGTLARGSDSDAARDVRGLRQAMEHAGVDDHEMGRRLDAIDALADSMDAAGLGRVKGKGRTKPTVQVMRDYAAAARAELGHTPETDYRDRRNGGGTDAGLPDTAPGSKPSDTPSADRAAAERIAPNRSLAGSPDEVRARREANEAAMAPAPGDADTGPNSVAPARAQQIAGQFLSRDGRRGRGTVQDAGRYSDDELEAAARTLDQRGTPGRRAAAGLRDFIGHRRREQETRERYGTPDTSTTPGKIGLDATKPDLRGTGPADGPELYRERLSKLDDATLAQALRRNDEMARTGQGPTRAQATDMAAAIRDIQRERREGGGGDGAGAPTPAQRNEAAARQLEADTAGTPGEAAGRRNAADLRATPEELEARYGAPNTDDQTAPGDERGQLATRARNAAMDNNPEGMETALDDLGHPDPEAAAETIRAFRSGRAREAAMRAEIMRADRAQGAERPGGSDRQRAADTGGDGYTPEEDAETTLSADDLDELDQLSDPDSIGDTDPRADQAAREDFIADMGEEGASVARAKIARFAEDGDNRSFIAADNPLTPKVEQDEIADAALARKVSLGEVDPETARAVRAGHAAGSPEVYGHEIRSGDTVVHPGTGQPVRVHGTTVRPNGDLTIRALDPQTQESREFDVSPAALARRGESPTGGDQSVAQPGDNAVVGTGEPDFRAREAAAQMAGDEGDGFTAEEDAAAAQGISAAELDEARAEAHQQQDMAMGVAELPDGDVEVEPEVADRQGRVEDLLTRAARGRLDLARATDTELGDTRQDLVDELALQNSLHRRNPIAYDARRSGLPVRADVDVPDEPDAPGRRDREVPGNTADVADVEVEAEPTPRRRPGVAGAAEDYAEALESGIGVELARENLLKSLRRSGASGEGIAALRAHLDADGDDDAATIREHIATMRAEARARRNEGARRRRTAKRLERDRIRSLIGQVDAQMRSRNLDPNERGGEVESARDAARADAMAEAAAMRSPGLYALTEDDDDRERLAKGKMINVQYRERVALVEAKIAEAQALNMETEKVHARGKDANGEPDWTPERRAQHDELIADFWAKHVAHVPREGKAMFSGGLGGAGKGTILGKDNLKIDKRKFAGIDPDEIKEILVERGMVEIPDGVSHMEMATLMHEESSYLSKRIQAMAFAEGRNVILDNTMAGKDGSKVRKLISRLRDAGYTEINAAFVEIPVETSVERALSRHRNGADRFMAGDGHGGRYVPPSVIRGSADPEGIRSSQNIKNFEEVSDLFDNYAHYDNSGKEPVFVKGKGAWATDPRLNRDSDGGSATGDVLEPVPTSPGMIDDAGPNGPPADVAASLGTDPDALARMTRAQRDELLRDVDGATLGGLADQLRERIRETPDGPQLRRLVRVQQDLRNASITRDMLRERDAEVAAGTRDARDYVWSGSEFRNGAKRAKVAGHNIEVGDTVRVPPGYINAMQRRGFDGTIVSEGVTGDGVAQQMAISSPGRPVFHVQRHSDGRLVEVSKPPSGRQRGVGLELYHPERAPQNPNAPATPDEPDAVDLDAPDAVDLDAPDSPTDDSSTTLSGVDTIGTRGLAGANSRKIERAAAQAEEGNDARARSMLVQSIITGDADLGSRSLDSALSALQATSSDDRVNAGRVDRARQAAADEVAAGRGSISDLTDMAAALRDDPNGDIPDELRGVAAELADDLDAAAGEAPDTGMRRPDQLRIGDEFMIRGQRGTTQRARVLKPAEGGNAPVIRIGNGRTMRAFQYAGQVQVLNHDRDGRDAEHVAMDEIATLPQNRRNANSVGERLAIRRNTLKGRVTSEDPRTDPSPEAADMSANALAMRFLGSKADVVNSVDGAALTLLRMNEGRRGDTSLGDSRADALDRLADALDAHGVGHVTRQRSGGGVSDKLRESARSYREQRDGDSPELIAERQRTRDAANAPAPPTAAQVERERRDRAELDRTMADLDRRERERAEAPGQAAADIAERDAAARAAGAGPSVTGGRPVNEDTRRSVQSFHAMLAEDGRPADQRDAGRLIADLADGGDPDQVAASVRSDPRNVSNHVARLSDMMRNVEPDEAITPDGEPFLAKLDRLIDRLRNPAPAGQQRDGDTASSRLNQHGAATAPALGEAMRVPPRGLNDRQGLTPAADPKPGDLIYAPAQGRMRGAVVTGVSRNGRVTYEFSNPTSAGRAFDDALQGRGKVRAAGGPDAYREQRGAERDAEVERTIGHLRGYRTPDEFAAAQQREMQQYDRDTERAIRNAGLARPDDVHPGSVSRTSKPDEVFEVPAGQRGIADDRSFDDELVGAGGARARG